MRIIIRIKLILILLCTTFIYSQIEVKGVVYDEYLQPFKGGAIVKNKNGHSFKTDENGSISINLKDEFPQKIFISATGFMAETIIISKKGDSFIVVLKESLAINDIVISASRTPEIILESPVDVLNFGTKDIRASIGSVYESIGYLPGVQIINNYNGFKSINTRGFGQFDNSRFVQLIDGMDSSLTASFLNQGDLGLPIDLDLESIEILPGSASALYGANAYNGLMLINTLSPFDHTGISVRLSMGGVNRRADLSSYDFSIRQAFKFTQSFAMKINFSYEQGEQWAASDYRNIDDKTGFVNETNISQISNFNGVNIYGDESIRGYDLHKISGYDYYPESDPTVKYFKNIFVGISRTGFSEKQLLGNDFKTKSTKFNYSLNLRPFVNKKYEFIFANNISLSDKIVQEDLSRYVLNDFYIIKSKLEFKADNFFLRFSKSGNKTGEAYDLKSLGYYVNEKLLSTELFADESYATKLYGKLLKNPIDRINLMKLRENADNHKDAIPRAKYNKFISEIKSKSITENFGSQIYDKSGYINIEGNYNVSKWINNFVTFQVGGSYRKYKTNSKGTLFNDLDTPIELEEHGFYGQVQKKILHERLKFTGSLRYDKNNLFKQNISPRLALNYILGTNKNHVFRMSYQTGFRNPSMQQLYSDRKLGAFRQVLGSANNNNNISLNNKMEPGFKDYLIQYFEWYYVNGAYSSKDYESIKANGFEIPNTTLDDVMNNSFLGHSSNQSSRDRKFRKNNYGKIQPEYIKTFELGYRSLFGLTPATKLEVNVNGFYSIHNDFISLLKLTTPLFGKIFPKGEGYFTDEEINKYKEELGDTDAFISSPNKEGKRQYLGSDLNWAASQYQGMYRESNVFTNMKSKVISYGFNVDAKTTLLNNKVQVKANYSFTDYKLMDKDNGLFDPSFNTPKHIVKFRVGYKKVIGNLGFELGSKWLDKYEWKSNFASAEIPERVLADGEINYVIPSINSIVKLGGTNLLDKKYSIAPGSGNIGSTYYVSWVIQN